jgi:hypothetical protein
MKPMRGYYSVVQFSPDQSRLEAVNVGVVLFCPEANFIAARTAASNRRAAKLLGRGELNRAALNSAKRALERRFEVDRDHFQSLDDLQQFVDTRANVLKLTDPRPIKILEPTSDIERLFYELVGGVPHQKRTKPIIPELDAVFRQLQQEGRARVEWEVVIPKLRRPLIVPYAYRNGAWNLVKPYEFSNREGPALGSAERLAIAGDLLSRFGEDEDGKKQLVVVASFPLEAESANLETRVRDVLTIYNVKTVTEFGLADFLSEVRQAAH